MIVTRSRATCYVGLVVGLLALMLFASVLARPAGAQVPVAPAADLSIQKFDFPPDQVAVGETLFYELAIANLGPGTATDAVVTDALPSNTEFLFTISGNCTNVGQTVTCALGDLAPNEQAFVEFAVCPTEPGTATNTATVSSGALDPDSSNNTATETTEVTTPAVGSCSAQKPPRAPGEPTPPTDNPQPGPTPPPNPVPSNPVLPQPEEPVANAGRCAAGGAVVIESRDFSIVCAGGQAIVTEGDVPDGILVGGGPAVEASTERRAVVRNSGALAVAGNGKALTRKP